MSFKFAEASISEKGTINGVKGDSTGTEVKIRDPYTHSKGWRAFIHPTASINKAVGIYARDIANNNHFGYGQSDRATGYNAVKNAGWIPANVTTNCNLDCSELVRTCVASALKKNISDFNTASEASVLLSLGYKEVTFNINALQHGMIVVTKTKGHTAVVTDPSVTSTATASTSTGTKYKVICSALTIRSGAGTSNKAIGYIHKGEVYTITQTQNNWGYIPSKKGWCSIASKYMQKV